MTEWLKSIYDKHYVHLQSLCVKIINIIILSLIIIIIVFVVAVVVVVVVVVVVIIIILQKSYNIS